MSAVEPEYPYSDDICEWLVWSGDGASSTSEVICRHASKKEALACVAWQEDDAVPNLNTSGGGAMYGV